MKKINLLVWLAAGMIVCLSCKKESDEYIPTSVNPLPPVVKKNTPPTAYAGYNSFIAWPADSAVLRGYAFDSESNIKSISWKKIAGPTFLHIETPDSLTTRLRNLEKGSYDLVLTVTDSGNLIGTDTVSVIVKEIKASPNEIIFSNMPWSCPMGCYIGISDFYSFLPTGISFKVFVKKPSESAWVEVVHESKWADHHKYVYGIDEGNFWLYTNDEDEATDIKIVY